MQILNIIHTVCSILISLFGLLYAYRTLYMIIGAFRTKKYPEAKCDHKYAVLVAARNEEKVLGNLLDSINRQDYPSGNITVFVAADNCTDSTADIARQYGAHCYERFDDVNKTKGFALQYLLNRIEEDFGRESFDGYFIFDADNLLTRDYIKNMNKAFDAGEKIVTSYRNTKNLDSNVICAGYALHWLRTARFESRARSFLGLSTWVQGCGFLFSSELVKDGWNFTSLAEDRAFSVNAVANGLRIGYQNEAVFYDEQPTDLKITFRQRIRWAKGHLEAFHDYRRPIIKGMFRSKGSRRRWNCYDMFMTMIPYSLVLIPIKVMRIISTAVQELAENSFYEVWDEIAADVFSGLIFEHFGVIPMGFALFILERKRIAKLKWYKIVLFAVTFPLFGIIGDIATWIAAFKKVTWQPIPHNADIGIDQLENREVQKVT